MQSAKAKKSSFKCPSFTAPIKSGDNSTAEQDGKKKQQTASSRDKADKDLESSNARNTSTVLLESKTEAGLDHKPSAKGDGSQSDEVDADKEETQEEELKNEDEEAQVVPHQSGPDEHGDKEQNNVQTKKSVQTEPEQKVMPVRSLTDEEYTAIFDAVLESGETFNIDVGKKPKQPEEAKADELDDKPLTENKDEESSTTDKPEKNKDVKEKKKKNKQRENETTPPGSEADPAEAFVGLAASPSKKKKKIKKRDKLEPKKLPFQEKQAAPASMVDQIKQMKKEKALKKKHKHTEEHTVPIKKAKLDSKAHTKPTKTSTITPVKKVNKRKKMIERELEHNGTWTHFHVVFFDERVSRGWVKAQHIMLLAGDEKEDKVIMTPKRYAKDVAAAKKNALHALKCDLKERIELFGFAARFKGIWEHKPVKVKEPGRSKKKAMSTTSKDQFNELLDETTMDEVLDNADSILDNVEDMLDSIDSDFIDSDEEASFVPHELVVVETKRKHKGRVVKDTKRVKIVSPPSTQEHEEEENQKTDNSDIEINNKLDAVTSKTDKFPTTRVNFDKEIFTMEMSEASDIDEIVLAVEETENQTGNKITKETNIKITKKEKKEVNKFKTDAKAKENQKNADTKESLEKNDSDIDVKAKEKHEEIKAVALQEQNVELTEKECNSVPEAEKQDEKPNQVKSFDDSCVNVEADSDDEMDLFDNIDNKVEKQEEPIENSETEARHEVNQSLEGSDIELSLEEHSLYDDVIAGDAKVRGRENIYAPREVSNEVPAVGMDGEDSDPFDLMEE
ncbi:hypothetical protein MAR_004710 [Mya arenaria]|uniref:Uncharacterized protein n=1 Tax=Mya arenaria TaxID=6604 RepID=A0ABY7EYZ2_MYAAR|nr:hypothetical protein MAR_004710 [Mya arenaria]